MNPEQKAAFIVSQTHMMINEREIMLAENEERARQGYSPANGPKQWQEFNDRWSAVLGYNAVISFFMGYKV